MHTGTTSPKKQFPQWEHRHCDEESLKRIQNGEKAITTYRDPIDVAESWKRRGWFEHEKFKVIWESQWSHYDAIINLDNVEVLTMDQLEHHLNHVDGTDNAGKYLDDDMINHARRCSEKTNG